MTKAYSTSDDWDSYGGPSTRTSDLLYTKKERLAKKKPRLMKKDKIAKLDETPKVTPTQALMIETKDKRKFLTYEKNFKELIEFATTFGAELSIVKIQTGNVLDLSPLACAISDGAYGDQPVVEVIEKKFPCQEEPISPEIIKMKDFVKELFLTNKTIYLHDLLEKFQNETTYSGLSNTLHRIRKELEEEGKVIEKIGPGRYKLAENKNK